MRGQESRRANPPKKMGHSRIEWPIVEVAHNSQLLRLCVRVASLGRCAALLLLRCAVLLLLGCTALLLRCAVLLLLGCTALLLRCAVLLLRRTALLGCRPGGTLLLSR
jgi:hypothetical protein